MNTLFLLTAQHNGLVIVPLETVCKDYFQHLTPEKKRRKVMASEIDLPITRIEEDRKAVKGAAAGASQIPRRLAGEGDD